MNRKQFAILVVLLIVLGGAGLLLMNSQKKESNAGGEGAGQKLLGNNFPINEVATVDVRSGTNEMNLVKKDDLWRVRERGDYPANFQQIGELLIKLGDLKVVQVEQVGPSQLSRLELATGKGTNSPVALDLKDKDGKSIKSLTLGKKLIRKPAKASPSGDEGFPDGRYVMVSGNSQSALLIGDPLSNVEPKPDQWLKKDFFHVERPKAIAVDFPVATNSWKIIRDTESGEWKFAEAKPDEKLDASKASGVSNPFSSASFNDMVPLTAKPEDNGLDKPTVVTIETFDDFTYTIKIGKKAGDDYPLIMSIAANFPKERTPAKDEKADEKEKADKAWRERQKQLDDKLKEAKTFEKWTYLVPAYTVDSVLKERKDLIAEKKEEKKDEPKAEPAADSGAEKKQP